MAAPERGGLTWKAEVFDEELVLNAVYGIFVLIFVGVAATAVKLPC